MKVLFFGLGSIGRRHLQLLFEIGEFEFICVRTGKNRRLRKFYENFYKFEDEKIEKLYHETRNTHKKIEELMKKNHKEIFLLSILMRICDRIRALLTIRVELETRIG